MDIIEKAKRSQEKEFHKLRIKEDEKVLFTSFFVTQEGIICEEIFNPAVSTPQFAVWDGSKVSYKNDFEYNGRIIKPISDDIVLKGLVKLPSGIENYASENELFLEIQNFINRYVDVLSDWRVWSSYYSLLAWVYDKLPVIPYLCALGPSDTGKTRFAQVVGSICYKPFFASGSITASPIFRILDKFRGTLIINEFDRLGELYSEIIIILNNGFEAGLPVVRTEGEKTKEVKVFSVFGPKIFASRIRKDDWAFESRLLTIPMRETQRKDIPPFLTEEFHKEAGSLRNKLLLFRFKHYQEPVNIRNDLFPSLKGRLRQTLLALTSVVKNEAFIKKAEEFGEKRQSELKSVRIFDLDNVTFQVLKEFFKEGGTTLTVKEIAERVREVAGLDKHSAKAQGAILRDELSIEPKRFGSAGNYTVRLNEAILGALSERYDLEESSESSGSSETGTHKTELTEHTELPQKDKERLTKAQQFYVETAEELEKKLG